MTPTIKDVAKEAQVSTATVSRVLTGNTQVSAELQKRVQSAVKKLNYQPGRLARSLRLKFAKTFGLVISDINDPFFSSVAGTVEGLASEHSYSTILCNSCDNPEKEKYYLEVLLSERVAGVILTSCNDAYNAQVERLLDAGIAVVCIDRAIQSPCVDTVLVDNVSGSKCAVSHLIAQGHKRIGALFSTTAVTVGRERRSGYKESLRQHKIMPSPKLVREINGKDKDGYDDVDEMVSLPKSVRPTALFIAAGHLALNALQAIKDNGLKVPEDIAVVVFDDAPFAQLVSPPLTVIRQPVTEIATLAMDCLMERIENPDTQPRTYRLQTNLEVRESCGAKREPESIAY